MPEGRIYYSFFTLVGISIVALSIFFSLSSINALHWPETQAEFSGQHDQIVSYSYHVLGEEYQLQMKLDSLDAPRTRVVYYNPSNPRQSTTSKGLPPIATMCILVGSILTFFSFGNAIAPGPMVSARNAWAGTQGSFPDH